MKIERLTMDDTRLETVASFLTRVDADLACGALQAAGIPAMVAADDAAGTRPHLWMSGVRLLVRAEDVECAKAILREAEGARGLEPCRKRGYHLPKHQRIDADANAQAKRLPRGRIFSLACGEPHGR